MSHKTPTTRHEGFFMWVFHQAGSIGTKSYVRRFFGFAVAITVCGIFADACGILPDLRRLPQILVFAVLGLIWGWLVGGRDTSSARRWKTAGRGVLQFSALGSLGFAVEVFSHLDNGPAFYAALSNLGWTIFTGLFVWILCFAATIKDVVPRNDQGGQVKDGSVLIDPWWYVGHSIAVVSCIALVFIALNQPQS